jgi:hypothetical protein
LLWHVARRAFSLARANAGKSIAARIAMMAMTTKSSMRVKPRNPALDIGLDAVRWVRSIAVISLKE